MLTNLLVKKATFPLPPSLLGGGVLLLIMVASAFVRLYNLPDSLQFLADQGRDASIVARIFREGDVVFIGPVTSVGNMYLGPLYYYFMVPWLWLTYPNPVGPAYAIAVLSILATYLLYAMGKHMIGSTAALTAAGLFAVSSVVVEYSRFSWNPNPEPLVGLIMLYCTYKAWTKDGLYWAAVGICFSILLQLHYVTLLAGIGAGFIWLAQLMYGYYGSKKQSSSWWPNWPVLRDNRFWLGTMGAILILFASLTPLVLFDWKHDWLNAKAFSNLLTKEESFARSNMSVPEKLAHTAKETHGKGMRVLFEITIGQQRTLNTVLLIVTMVTLTFLMWGGFPSRSTWVNEHRAGFMVIGSYLISGIVGIAAYEHSVFDHYIAFLFPVTFLTLASVGYFWWKHHIFGKLVVTAFGVIFVIYNLPRIPLKDTGWTMFEIQATADSIASRVTEGEPYSIVLLSATGDVDGLNYRYYLETTATPPLSLANKEAAQLLFIINEDHKLMNVTQSPIREIATFPDKEVKEVYTIPDGPEITVLRRK